RPEQRHDQHAAPREYASFSREYASFSRGEQLVPDPLALSTILRPHGMIHGSNRCPLHRPAHAVLLPRGARRGVVPPLPPPAPSARSSRRREHLQELADPRALLRLRP